jgi:lysophospholipase L1-like esterase
MRRVLGITGPIAVGLLVGAVGLELLARLSWEDGWRDPSLHGGPDGEDLPVVHGLRELARANQHSIHRNVYHRTNSRGLRGPERSPTPAPGTFRIAVTGDSTTMGSGVLEEDRYTDLIERRLGPGYEVLNVGLSGLNTDGVVGRLAQLSRHYRSHLFVYGFSLNDIEGPSYQSRAQGPLPAEFGNTYWAGVAALERSPSYFWRFLGAWRLARNRGKVDPNAEVLTNFLENPAAWAEFVAGLERYAALAESHGVCAHLLVHAHVGELDEGHPYLEVYDRVEAAALDRGLSVSQSYPYFARKYPGNEQALWVSLFDPHPNREGHALLAEALHDGLKQLPAECWEPR